MKNQNEKIKEVEVLFDKIKNLFPKGNVSLSIHDIDVTNLNKKWKVQANYIEESKRTFLTAKRKEDNSLTLFD